MLLRKEKRMGYKILDSAQPQDRDPDVNVSIVALLFNSSSIAGSDRPLPVLRLSSCYTLKSGFSPGSVIPNNEQMKQLNPGSFFRAKLGNWLVSGVHYRSANTTDRGQSMVPFSLVPGKMRERQDDESLVSSYLGVLFWVCVLLLFLGGIRVTEVFCFFLMFFTWQDKKLIRIISVSKLFKSLFNTWNMKL